MIRAHTSPPKSTPPVVSPVPEEESERSVVLAGSPAVVVVSVVSDEVEVDEVPEDVSVEVVEVEVEVVDVEVEDVEVEVEVVDVEVESGSEVAPLVESGCVLVLASVVVRPVPLADVASPPWVQAAPSAAQSVIERSRIARFQDIFTVGGLFVHLRSRICGRGNARRAARRGWGMMSQETGME